MKKIVSLILAFVLLFSLAACNGADKDNQTTTIEDITYTTKPKTTKPATSSADNTDEASDGAQSGTLPDSFPQIPAGAEVTSVVYHPFDAETVDLLMEYNNDYFEVNLRCSETSFGALASNFNSKGWRGNGFVQNDENLTNTPVGFWRNDEWAALVTKGVAQNLYDGFQYSVTIDVIKCSFEFPNALEKYFPAFNGYSPFEETYYAYDTNGVYVNEFTGVFVDPAWCWEFRRDSDSAFIGVTQNEIDDYLDVLYQDGFTLYTNTETTIYGSIIYYDAVKIVDESIIYSVSMCYTQYLMLFEIVYSNNLSTFVANGHFGEFEEQ